MQTALAVRECILKLFEVLNYVVVYFIGVLTMVQRDWRLTLPMLAWLAIYMVLLRIFIPKIGKVSEEQADARSSMTGRVVDSYANIQTVKLFSHAKREASYAKEAMGEFMDTVYRSMRLGTALFTLLGLLN
jgi:ATP-binding cassette subfamily B multidrug efflux pump